MQQEKIIKEMLYRVDVAEELITTAERLARGHGVKITAHLGAELAHTHDALAELAEQIREL